MYCVTFGEPYSRYVDETWQFCRVLSYSFIFKHFCMEEENNVRRLQRKLRNRIPEKEQESFQFDSIRGRSVRSRRSNLILLTRNPIATWGGRYSRTQRLLDFFTPLQQIVKSGQKLHRIPEFQILSRSLKFLFFNFPNLIGGERTETVAVTEDETRE